MASAATRSVLRQCRPRQRSPSDVRSPLNIFMSRPPSAFPTAVRLRTANQRSLSSATPRSGSQSGTENRAPPPGKFSYGVAASYIGKDRPFDPLSHVFHFNPYNRLQEARKGRTRPESGQDAFFVSRIGNSGGVALGVADGVGGWMDSGVDPADFSHGLCEAMAALAAERKDGAGAGVEPLSARQLMQMAYEAVCHNPAIKAGGSTAIVGLLTEDGKLEVANLGDSGFVQLRLNAMHAYSEPQTHAFNTPFQLSVIPPSVLARMATFGGQQLSDLPRDAEVSRHGLRHGDVLVFASDGVWDNLFNQDILRIVSRTMTKAGAWRNTDSGIRVVSDLSPFMSPDTDDTPPPPPGDGDHAAPIVTLQSILATEITAAAKAASVNQKLDGPFSKEVKKYYPQETWHGGKVDDICVIVAIVGETAKPVPMKARL